jgi:tetratricopeptide (TPR) repeat protein
MAKSLPAQPAIVLADDPARLYLAMGAAGSLGLPNQYIFVESRSLIHREYLRYLADRYPSLRKELVNPDRLPPEVSSRVVGDLLAHLAQRGAVYYLHPSFGSYFEQVYMTPHHMGGYLHPYPTNTMALLALTPAAIATNQAYWHALEGKLLVSLPDLAKPGPDGLLRSLDATRVAYYYSQMLDTWGVELQKSATELKLTPQIKEAMLKDANSQFDAALRLNTNNAVARANQQYNAHLRGVQPAGPLFNAAEAAAQSGGWDVVYNRDGPTDVPVLDIQVGRYFAEFGALRQAAQLFQRCLELAPNEPLAELDLAKTYVDLGLLDPALDLLRAIPETTSSFGYMINPLERVRVEALAYAKKNDFAQADKLLTEGRAKNPRDENFVRVTAEFYRLMGYSVLRESSGNAAKEQTAEKDSARWFQKSLAALDEELKLLNAPMEVTAHAVDIPRINLQRSEMQMMLKDYPGAILTCTAMLRQDPQNPVVLLNRAISELQSGQLDPAKKDYQLLEKTLPEPSFMVYYGLAQVAQKQNDKPAEIIRYDKLYLQYAPHNTAEFTNVTQQLHKLEGH